MLNELEKAHSCKENIMKQFDSELTVIISLVEDEKTTKEQIKDSLWAFHKKITALEEK